MWSLPCIDLFPFFLFNMNAFLKVFIWTWWIAAVLDWTPFMLTLPRTFLHSAGHNPSLSASRVIYRPALLPSWQLDRAYLVSSALWVTLAAWGVNMIPVILICLGCHSKILKSCLTFIPYTQGDLETEDQGPKGFHVWGGLSSWLADILLLMYVEGWRRWGGGWTGRTENIIFIAFSYVICAV